MSAFSNGAFGIVGMTRMDGKDVVYKLSDTMTFSMAHEYQILKILQEKFPHLPHFARPVKLETRKINPRYAVEDPFAIDGLDKVIETEVLFVEFVSYERGKNLSLYNLIHDTNTPTIVLTTILLQVLCALDIAQTVGFAHFDLHPNNVLLKKTSPDAVHVYQLSDGSTVCVPTMGFLPVIIDFGPSQIMGMRDDSPFHLDLEYTNLGYLHRLYHPLTDARRLLIHASGMIEECRNRQTEPVYLRNIVMNVFSKSQPDMFVGHDFPREECVQEELEEIFTDLAVSKSSVFVVSPSEAMCVLRGVCSHKWNVYQGTTVERFRKAVQVIYAEFGKIEEQIHDPFWAMYVLRQMVKVFCGLKSEARENAPYRFEQDVFTEIYKIAKYVKLSHVNFPLLYFALVSFQEHTETSMCNRLEYEVQETTKFYDKIPVQELSQLCEVIQINFETLYEFSRKSVVYFFSQTEASISKLDLMDEYLIGRLNDTEELFWGVALRKLKALKLL